MRRYSIIPAVCALLLILVILTPQSLFGDGYKYYGKGKRDPFISLVSGEIKTSLGLEVVETIEDVELEGIIFDPLGGSMAVLNGEVVKEGDKFYNVEVGKIDRGSLTIKIYDRPFIISLAEEGGEAVER